MKLKSILSIFTSIFLINLASAQYWGAGSSPIYLLENEWVRFIAIFMVLFSIIYLSLIKTFKENKSTAVVIAIGITVLITVAVAQRGWLYTYSGDELGSWISILAIFIAAGFIIKLAHENFGIAGTLSAIIIAWALITFNSYYFYGFYSPIINSILTNFFQWPSAIITLIIMLVIGGILSNIGKKKESIADKFMANFLKPR